MNSLDFKNLFFKGKLHMLKKHILKKSVIPFLMTHALLTSIYVIRSYRCKCFAVHLVRNYSLFVRKRNACTCCRKVRQRQKQMRSDSDF